MGTGPEGLTELQDKGSKVYVYGICVVAATKGRTLEDIERMWLRAG